MVGIIIARTRNNMTEDRERNNSTIVIGWSIVSTSVIDEQ